MLTFIILCLNSRQNSSNPDFCMCKNTKPYNDTLTYSTILNINKITLEVITVLYDTTVIPREAMGIEENVVYQSINFKKDGKVVKTYKVPSETTSIYNIYKDEIKPNNYEKTMSLNHIYSVKYFFVDSILFFLFEGGENLIEKREYFMLSDSKGNIYFEKYFEVNGDLNEFMKENEMYEAWSTGKLKSTEVAVYPIEACCKVEESVIPHF